MATLDMAGTTASPAVVPDRNRHQAILWGLLILAAFAVRLHCWYRAPVITIDGAGFAQWAQIGQGSLNALLASPEQEPVYPLLLGTAARLLSAAISDEVRRYLLAGWLLGTAGSLLTAWGIYRIGRLLFDSAAAWLGALLVVLLPELVTQSANVMTEPVFLAFLTLSATCLLAGLTGGRGRNLGLAAGCGVLLAGAFLTRKEGMVALPVYLLFLLLPGLPPSRGRRVIMGTMILAAMGAGLLLFAVAGGRVAWLVSYEAIWRTARFLILLTAGMTVCGAADPSAVVWAKTLHGWRDCAWEPFHRWLGLGPWPTSLAALAFFPLHHNRPIPRTLWLLPGLMTAFLAVVYAHAFHIGGFVGRYLLPAAVFAMPLAAAAIVIIGRGAAARVGMGRPGSPRQAGIVAGAVAAGFVLTAVILNAARPTDKDSTLLDACRWLTANAKAGEPIWTLDSRISFYLQRPCVVPNYYTTFQVDYDNEPDTYRRIVWFVFLQRRGDEGRQEEFLQYFLDVKRPAPRLAGHIARPGCYDVFVYRQ